ncbi:MAG TPA: phosphate ABC transporter permease family protein, partial [Allosphingosinicella sp.]|nr:phosphate ABC transporter permease family protein [Allosphingosinicella sp.]
MTVTTIALVLVGLGVIAWFAARAKAKAFVGAGKERLHSLPNYHGWYVALWAAVPALAFLAIWSNLSGGLIFQAVMASPEAAALPAFDMQRQAILGEAYALATGAAETAFNPQARALAPVYASAISFYFWLGLGVALLIAFAAGALAFSRVSPRFRARTRVERWVMAVLLIASLIAVLTTLGIL